MTDKEKLFCSRLLKRAADVFRNIGSNDMPEEWFDGREPNEIKDLMRSGGKMTIQGTRLKHPTKNGLPMHEINYIDNNYFYISVTREYIMVPGKPIAWADDYRYYFRIKRK